MNFKLRLLALLLVVMIALSSCSLDSILSFIPWFSGDAEETTTTTTTPIITPEKIIIDEENFSRDNYSTNKAELLEQYTATPEEFAAAMDLLDRWLAGSLPVEEGATVGALTIEELDAMYVEFETAFYHLAEQRTIATIIYYCDTSDEVASTRYLDTQDAFLDLNDKYNIVCREMYLNSPYSAELFEGWTEEEIQALLDYDPEIMALRKQIEELQVEVDNLNENSPTYNDESAALYVQIITLNNQLAALYGYDNYYEYASENVYDRDYKAEDLAAFREYVIEYIVPAFGKVYSDFKSYSGLKEWKAKQCINFIQEDFDDLSKNYLLMYLNSLEGAMGESMRNVFANKNCIFANMGTSHPTAFCTYLYERETPFCLFGSSGQESKTIAHEIGHYYAYDINADLNNYDLCETHSQGNEYLFLNYIKDEFNADAYKCIRAYQLVNACYIMIMATIIDEFEQIIYSLDSVEGMTSADFDAIMTEVCEKYGGQAWVSANLTDPYKYWRLVAISNPVYYISYAISAVSSTEIFYIAEEVGQEEAYAVYRVLVEGVTPEDGYLGALSKAGLGSPFDEETYERIYVTLTK